MNFRRYSLVATLFDPNVATFVSLFSLCVMSAPAFAIADDAIAPQPPIVPLATIPEAETRNAVSRSRDQARALSMAFRTAADKVLPSVVTVLAKTQGGQQSDTGILDVITKDSQRDFDSFGSGVIISSEGIVLTNHHVVENASRVDVRLDDGRQFTALQSQSDVSSDIAILRIEGEDLPIAELGDSNDLYVGDWVLAVGSPFSLESSVSAGIVSDSDRISSISAKVSGIFIQTDAAVNPGNSGGPLVDLDGRVVGINTAISSRTGSFQGIGFAIPISRAKWVKSELLEHGRVRRAYIGVRVNLVPYSKLAELGLKRRTGAYVESVTPGYPGSNAGLEPRDIIIDLAGQKVDSHAEFSEIVQQSPIGESISMTIIRDGEEKILTVKLQEHPFRK